MSIRPISDEELSRGIQEYELYYNGRTLTLDELKTAMQQHRDVISRIPARDRPQVIDV